MDLRKVASIDDLRRMFKQNPSALADAVWLLLQREKEARNMVVALGDDNEQLGRALGDLQSMIKELRDAVQAK